MIKAIMFYCYGTGKAAIDWIVSWFFAPNREEAIELTSDMLRNGFFHAIEEESEGGGKFQQSTIAVDKGKFSEFQDKESARYIFVSEDVLLSLQ